MITAAPPDDGQTRYTDLLFSNYPEDFFRAWIRAVDRAYRDAHVYAYGSFEDPEAHDVLGHVRRAQVEDATRRVAESFGFYCPAEKNGSKNYHHRVLKSGMVVLTECYSDDHRVRSAVHREELARESWAGDLFLTDQRKGTVGGPVFGMLVHGAHPKPGGRLGYVKAVFPDADCDRYLTEIDLLRRFPIEAPAHAPEEELAGETEMMPRRQSKDVRA